MSDDKGGGAKSSGRGQRDLKQRVKRTHKFSHSSQLWLNRQLNDPYVKKAKTAGWRSRAAFKLIELDDKHHFLKSGQRLVDLGCAPGGWAQVAAERIGLQQGKGRIVGIDVLEVEPVPGVELLQMDFMDEDAPERLQQFIGGQVDGVMSDMAANTTGHKKTDHLRIITLVEAAFDFACEVLKPGGAFVAKLRQGAEEQNLVKAVQARFAKLQRIKPPASRAESAEFYFAATGFKG